MLSRHRRSSILNQPFDGQGFSSFSIPCPYTENQYMANADYQQSAKSKFSIRFFAANSQTTESLPANAAVVRKRGAGFAGGADQQLPELLAVS